MDYIQKRKLKTKVIAPASVYNILREKLKNTNKEAVLLQNLLNEYSLIEFSEEKAKYQIQELLLKNSDVKKFTYLNDYNFINRIYKLLDDINAQELSEVELRANIISENMQNFELYKHLELLLDKKIETYSVFLKKIQKLISKDIKEGKLELTYISDFYSSVEKKFLEDLNLKQDELEKEIFKENAQNPQAKYFKNMREEVEWIALNIAKENISETKLVLADSAYLPFVKSVFARHNIPITYKEKESTFKYDLQVLLDYIIADKSPAVLIEKNFFKLDTIREIVNFYNISATSEKIVVAESDKPLEEFEKFNARAEKYQEFLKKKNDLDSILDELTKKVSVAKLLNLIDRKITYNNLETVFKNTIERNLEDLFFSLNITKLTKETARFLKSKISNISVAIQSEVASVAIYNIGEISPYKETAYILGTNIDTYPTYKKDYALFEKFYTVLKIDNYKEEYKRNIEDLKLQNKSAKNVIYTIALNDIKGKSIYSARFNFAVDGLEYDNEKIVLESLNEKDYKKSDSDARYNLNDANLEKNKVSSITKSLFMKNLKDLKGSIIQKILEDKKLVDLTLDEKAQVLEVLKNKIKENKKEYYIFNEILEYYSIEDYKNIKSIEEFLEGGEDVLYIRTSVSRLKSLVDSPLTRFIEEVTRVDEDLDFNSSATKGTIQHKVLEELYGDSTFIELIKSKNQAEISRRIEEVTRREVNEYFRIFNKTKGQDLAIATFTSNVKGVVDSLKEYDEKSIKEEQEYSFVVNISKYAKNIDFSKNNFLDTTDENDIEKRTHAEDIEKEYATNVFKKYPVFISGFIDRLIETEDTTYLIDYKSSAKKMNLPGKRNRFKQNYLDKIELQLPTYVIARAIEQASSEEEYKKLLDKISTFYVTINSKQDKRISVVEANRKIGVTSFPINNTKEKYKLEVVDYYKILSMRINKYLLSGKIYKTHKDCVFTNNTFKVNIDSRGKRGE